MINTILSVENLMKAVAGLLDDNAIIDSGEIFNRQGYRAVGIGIET